MTVKEQALALVKEAVNKANRNSDLDWLEIKDKYNFEHSGEHLRKMSSGFKWLEDNGIVNFSNIELSDYNTPNYRESTEITSNGQQKSDKLIEMSEDNKKDEKYILEAHGYCPTEWQIVNAKHSIYNVNAKGGITKTLYSSKITVKPKESGINYDLIAERLTKNIKLYKRTKKVDNGKNLLEIFLTDMHYGVNDFDYYKDTLDEILELLESKKWDTVYIPIGSDLLHNNDLTKGRTVNDTIIEKVDMEKAWEGAYKFYSILYECALNNSNKVVSHYVCGNHDKDSAYGVVKALSKVYTEVEWDTSPYNKKLFTWKDVAILCMHGDRGSNRITKTAYKEYGKLIADKKVFEIHTGDKHHTKTDDSHGVIFRILPTRAKTDEWHAENSFTGSSQCFHIFEYKEDMLKTIYHV